MEMWSGTEKENLSKDESEREEVVEKTIKEWLEAKESQEFNEKV